MGHRSLDAGLDIGHLRFETLSEKVVPYAEAYRQIKGFLDDLDDTDRSKDLMRNHLGRCLKSLAEERKEAADTSSTGKEELTEGRENDSMSSNTGSGQACPGIIAPKMPSPQPKKKTKSHKVKREAEEPPDAEVVSAKKAKTSKKREKH